MSASPVALSAPRARRRPFPTRAAVVVALALAVALICSFVATNVYASLAQRDLAAKWDASYGRYQAMDPVARSGITYPAGDPVARLRAPAMGLDAIAVEGATASHMRRGIGHLPGSAVPGETGVAILTGNRFGFGAFFQRLDRLAAGDEIIVQSAFGSTTYSVIEVRVVPASSLDLSMDSTRRVLILFGAARFCCTSDRIVVRAVAGEAL